MAVLDVEDFVRAVGVMGKAMKKMGQTFDEVGTALGAVFTANAAYQRLSREEKVAVRLRYGRNIVEWWKAEHGQG